MSMSVNPAVTTSVTDFITTKTPTKSSPVRINAIDKARQIWAQYKDVPVASTPGRPPEIQMTAYDKLAQSLDVTEACDDEDELEKFINGSPCKIAVSPLEWWTREEQRMEYPRLYKMAINVLSIAPMSDKAEHVFSGARRTVVI